MSMTEICFCGRAGELTDREPVVTDGRPALRCPVCDHVDDLGMLSESIGLELWTLAKDRELAMVDPVAAPGTGRSM